MEKSRYYQWLSSRSEHRDILFEKSTALAPQLGSIATMPLTTLSRLVGQETSGKSRIESIMQIELEEGVYNILNHHNRIAEKENTALFSILPEYVEHIADLTGGVIARWDRACYRKGRKSPFAELVITYIVDADFECQDVQLVIETASSIMELMMLGYTPRRANDNQQLMSFIARRGPAFATAWASGDILHDYCQNNGLDPDDMLALISSARRIIVALESPADPLTKAVNQFKNFTQFTPAVLAAELNWSLQRTEEVFTPAMRAEITRRSSASPLEKAKVVAAHLDTTLTTQNLAEKLGISPDEVDDLFYPSDRAYLALYSNPMAKARRIAKNYKLLSTGKLKKRLGWSDTEIEELFTPGYRRKIAMNYRNVKSKLGVMARMYKETLAIENIASYLGWTQEETAATFANYIRKELSVSNPKNVWKQVRVIANRGRARRRT